MKRKGLLLIGLIGISLGSCIEHEVIPAPTPTVDLASSFEGNIGGQFIEYTRFVAGYDGVSDISIQSQFGTNTAQYSFAMMSDQSPAYVRVRMGSIVWSDGSGTYRPELSLFNAFFSTNTDPDYSDGALNGFEVTYRTAYDSVFVSREGSTYLHNVAFDPASIIQESDESGDYSKFTCTFNCYVYNDYVDEFGDPQTDSILIQNAIYKGWFKR